MAPAKKGVEEAQRLSRIEPAYGEQSVATSRRQARAAGFVREVRGRKFVNEVEVLVELGPAVDRVSAPG